MESLLSINGVAQVLSLIGLPALIGTVALATIVLTGGAERIVLFVEDAASRFFRHDADVR